MLTTDRPLRVFTWHVHGTYLYYLSQVPVEFYLPVKSTGEPGYGGRGSTFPFPQNVHEVPAEEVKDLELDCILFQSSRNFLEDQYRDLSDKQRALPRIYLEHDPPRENPTDTCHLVDDPSVLLVHVTHFNQLMWDSGRTPNRVIEHGVIIPQDVHYTGERDRGIVVINELKQRGRRLGVDVFERVRQDIPLDLVGMKSEEMGGLGEVHPMELAAYESQYRFFFNPIRYTSLGLAVCEAMMVGMPIVGLSTTEMVSAVENGVNGYVSTDLCKLTAVMQELLRDPSLGRYWGENAREVALENYNIERFTRDWLKAFRDVTGC